MSAERVVLWGSEIRPFKIQTFLKVGFQMVQFSNGPVFKWSGFSSGYSHRPNHLKTGPFKIRTFLSGFQIVFDKMAPFVWISNGWASRFQILFKIWTICNPTSFWPFEDQISPDFRSSLYCKINFFCRRIFEAVQTLCWGRSSPSCHHQSFQTGHKLGNFTPLDLDLTFNRIVPSGLGQSAKLFMTVK